MSDDSSEEKKHDASSKKLKDLREKGQVPTAQEATQSANTAVILSMCLLLAPSIAEQSSLLFRDEFFDISGQDFSGVLRARFFEILSFCFNISIWFLGAAAIVGVVVTLGISGFTFSAEGLTPDINKINPIQGFQNTFGIKGLKTFLMHILRLAFSVSAAGAVAWYLHENLLASTTCEFACGLQSVARVVAYTLSTFLIIYLFTAPIDYIVSISEFMREQKMTDTEVKNEQKETLGSPEIRQTMNELRNEAATKVIGAQHASFILHNGKGRGIAVFYDQEGGTLPNVVAKFNTAEKMDRAVRKYKIRVEQDTRAVELLRKVPIGDYISDDDQIDAIIPYI